MKSCLLVTETTAEALLASLLNDGGTMVFYFLFGHPKLMERAQGRQDRASDPTAILSLNGVCRGMDFDFRLPRGLIYFVNKGKVDSTYSKTGELEIQPFCKTSRHSGSTGKNNVTQQR
jgi:hypothetical protein